jgi:hypothetical protein
MRAVLSLLDRLLATDWLRIFAQTRTGDLCFSENSGGRNERDPKARGDLVV